MLRLILLKGHPGTGKSSLAHTLAQALQPCALVDRDDMRDAAHQHDPTNACGLDWTRLSSDIMWRIASRQLSLGLSVVVDCPLSSRALFDTARALAGQVGAAVVVVEVICSDKEVWQQRLEFRAAEQSFGQGHKPCSWASLQQLIKGYDGHNHWTAAAVEEGALPANCLLCVDMATNSVAEATSFVVSRLNPNAGAARAVQR